MTALLKTVTCDSSDDDSNLFFNMAKIKCLKAAIEISPKGKNEHLLYDAKSLQVKPNNWMFLNRILSHLKLNSGNGNLKQKCHVLLYN